MFTKLVSHFYSLGFFFLLLYTVIIGTCLILLNEIRLLSKQHHTNFYSTVFSSAKVGVGHQPNQVISNSYILWRAILKGNTSYWFVNRRLALLTNKELWTLNFYTLYFSSLVNVELLASNKNFWKVIFSSLPLSPRVDKSQSPPAYLREGRDVIRRFLTCRRANLPSDCTQTYCRRFRRHRAKGFFLICRPNDKNQCNSLVGGRIKVTSDKVQPRK